MPNTVFTITPPDISINNTGPGVLFLGMTLLQLKPYITIIDSLFPLVEIAYYASNESIDHTTVDWHRAIAGLVTSIFINIDNATTDEVVIALENESASASVYWIGSNMSTLKQLLNSYQYQIFPDMKTLSKHLKHEFSSTE